jgi:putative SOS response-associated peptidase YedK
MRQFHKAGDEKRTPVVIAPELHEAWLSAEPFGAKDLMTWAHMPELRAGPYDRVTY